MRSISRVPRCQQRNNSRLRRSSRPPLDRVDPVILDSNPNAKSPDVPGGVDITSVPANVSSYSPYKFTTQPVCCVRASATHNGKLTVGSELAFLVPPPFSGEGRPQRGGGRGGGDVRMRLADRPPPDTSYRCAHDVPPSPRRRGRDEDPRY